jgi:thioredoxin 2
MAQENLILRCAKCGAKNRISRTRLSDRPVCGKCKEPLKVSGGDSSPCDVNDQTFNHEVLSHHGPVLVDCWAPWCGPCRMVAPILDQLASEYAGRLKIAKLNTDENPSTASRYGIQSIPTMLLFKNGQLTGQIVGAQPKQEIERQIQPIL